jgi:hypothetical protein
MHCALRFRSMLHFSPSSIERMNLAAAILHAVQAVIVLAIACWQDQNTDDTTTTTPDNNNNNDRKMPRDPFDSRGGFAVHRTARVWHTNGTLTAVSVPSGSIDVRYIMIVFFALSAIFQGTASAFWSGRSGVLRYVEYSLTASCMIMAIAVEVGIRDVYTIECMFFLVWITMYCGVAADFAARYLGAWTWVFPHLAGWATLLAAYVPIIDSFLLSSDRSELQAPAFVRALIIVEFLFFSCFGFVQVYGLANKARLINDKTGEYFAVDLLPEDNDESDVLREELLAIDDSCEGIFIFLSLSAKTSLCWIILSPTLVP